MPRSSKRAPTAARPVKLHYVGDDSTYVVGASTRGTFEVDRDEAKRLVATGLYARGAEPDDMAREASPVADRPAPEPEPDENDEDDEDEDEAAGETSSTTTASQADKPEGDA